MPQKLSTRQMGNTYSTASETQTGETWIDGKPIFRQSFSQAVSPSGSEQAFNIGLSTSLTRIIKVEGGYMGSTSTSDFWPLEYVNPAASTSQNAQFKLRYVNPSWQFCINTGGTGTVIFTVYYVK